MSWWDGCRDVAIADVISREGGWSDDPRDPGGATNMGVTLATYRRYVDADASADDLRGMSRAVAERVYRDHYWDAVRGGELPCGVAYAVVDYAVHSGVSRAVVALQRVLGVPADGVVGPVTMRAAREAACADVVRALCAGRRAFVRGLSAYTHFGRGWERRIDEVEAQALRYCERAPSVCRVCEWVRWLVGVLVGVTRGRRNP